MLLRLSKGLTLSCQRGNCRVRTQPRGGFRRAAPSGRAEELERTRPFGVLAAAFGCTRSSPDPRRAAIAALLASQGAGDLGPITVTSDPGLRFRVVDAFTDLAARFLTCCSRWGWCTWPGP
jgi:hypothetical protein